MPAEAAAARLHDPVAHSEALGGFLAGALVGVAAAAGVAALVGLAASAAAVEMASGGLATPLVAGAVATVGEFGVNLVVGGLLTAGAEKAGEEAGAKRMGPRSGEIADGSPNVQTNGRRAARTLDPETCHDGKLAEGSRTVHINGRPAARAGDKLTCGGAILDGSSNVRIGGPTARDASVQSEVPTWVRWAVVAASALPALGAAARAAGTAIAEVSASGFSRAAQVGAKALARAMEERAGGGAAEGGSVPPGGTAVESGSEPPPVQFGSRTVGQTEPGAVPSTPELQAQINAAKGVQGRSASGYPDLPPDIARTFGDDVRPWDGDEQGGNIYRIIDSNGSANGGFWRGDVPQSEEDWRAGSAVRGSWNGDGGYVQSSTDNLRGWIGAARPQPSDDGANVLPGGDQQIWIPPGSASPGSPMPTPWNTR